MAGWGYSLEKSHLHHSLPEFGHYVSTEMEKRADTADLCYFSLALLIFCLCDLDSATGCSCATAIFYIFLTGT